MTPETGRNLNTNIKGWVILIIDDMPDNLKVAKTALKFHGAEVFTAIDGESGLELLKTIQPNVILLDIRMPKMDGWAVFRSIRENPVTAPVPVIAITAYAMDSDKDEVLQAGFNGYISKPFDIFTFVQEVERLTLLALKNRDQSEDKSV